MTKADRNASKRKLAESFRDLGNGDKYRRAAHLIQGVVLNANGKPVDPDGNELDGNTIVSSRVLRHPGRVSVE